MRRKAITQRVEARRQHINREQTRLAELQYTIDILRQQEQRQEPQLVQRQHQDNINPLPPYTHIPLPPPQFDNILHYQPTSPPHNQFFQPPPLPPPQLGNIDPKSPHASHLQLVPWPFHYRATTPPKYHGNTEPPQIPYVLRSRHSLSRRGRSIYSWQQLKEKFLLNLQGSQEELDMKEDFLSCAQRGKETLPNFYGRFLQLKA
jgi:hypothetical protein